MTILCMLCNEPVVPDDNWWLDYYMWEQMPSNIDVLYSCKKCGGKVRLTYRLDIIRSEIDKIEG